MPDDFYVPPIGIRGGIAVWWKVDVQVDILYDDKNIIDCRVQVQEDGLNMHITWVY